MSLKRAPLPPEEATRGSAVNYPFWPGGFDAPEWKLGMSLLLCSLCCAFVKMSRMFTV